MITDPLDRQTFQALMTDVGAWIPAWERATRPERARLYGVHHRRFLMLTPAGRARVRQWFDAQQRPIVVEDRDSRSRRVLASLKFFGDVDVLPVCIRTIAALPRPVVDYVLDACMIVVVGRRSSGWTSGFLPRRLPILVAGHRSDDEIAPTLRHELGHRWLLEQDAEVSTAQEIEQERSAYCERIAAVTGDRADADRFARLQIGVHELQACALAAAWGAMPC